ncbi:neutral amino acid permease [Fusarium sp. NRRL 52700]|nr:neutral amino acid permease [Fusarium sp. NRRL 52700]
MDRRLGAGKVESSTSGAQASLLLSYVVGEIIPGLLAEERVRKVLEMDPESQVALYALSRVIESKGESASHLEKVFDLEVQMAGCWEPMITFFERLLDESQDGPNTTGEFLMDRLVEPGEDFLSFLVKPVETSAGYDLLEPLFVRAIAKVTSKGDQGDLFTIRYYYGKTLFSIKGQEETGIEVWELYKNEAMTELHERAVNLIDTYMVPTWLELATAKYIDPIRAQGFFDKIEAAYVEFEALESHDIERTVAIAQYFRYRGDTDKAKQILRRRVTEAL